MMWEKLRSLTIATWMAAIGAALYYSFFRHDSLPALLGAAARPSPIWASAVYLLLGCVRGFTLVPATTLLVAGLLVLPPLPLFGLTLAGIVVSSAAVYYFSEVMRLGERFERTHPAQVAKLRTLMARHELPIVILWAFFPLAPTDLVCYVCGALKIDVRKCLLGVLIGEGAVCGIYILLGTRLLAKWV